MRSAAALLVSTATAAALALAPAAASAQWLAPTPIGQLDTYSFEPAVTAAPDGGVTALWPRIADGRIAYVTATRPAGGAWSAPHTLDAMVSGASALDIVSSPDGTTTAAWIASVGAGQAIRTATRAPGGAWGTPQSLSDDVRSSEQIDLAAGPDGTVAAIWRRYDGSRWIVQGRVRPAGGAWGAVADLSAAGQDAGGPRVALDGQGTAHAIWSRSNGSRTIAQVATKPADGGWSAGQPLSGPGHNAGNTQIAVSPAGDAVVAWTRGTTPTSAQAATRPAGGAWSAIHDLPAAGRTASDPQAGIDRAGSATVVWGEEDGGTWRIRAATRPAGAAWSSAATLSDTSRSAFAPTLAVSLHGAAVAGWLANDGSTSRIEAAHRAAGGAWTAPTPVSASGRVALYPQLALDGRGNAVMAWERATDADATRHEIQAAGFDGEAPTVGAIDGPAAATVGAPVAFSSAATDVWSPVQLGWSFGDDATAPGPSVTHAFPAAGERQVTVTATDATGRASSATRAVAVSPAPLPTPPGDGGRDGRDDHPAALRATVAVVRQRLGAIARQKALRATCRLTAAGRCTVTATIPARAARALGLKAKRSARAYTLGSKTVRIAKPGARATATIALDRAERRALARARTLKVTVTASAGAARATATATLRR